MAWPTLDDYQDAVRRNSDSTDDAELQSGQIELDVVMKPRTWGARNYVFKIRCPTRTVALTCFLNDTDAREERYCALKAQLINPLLNRFFAGFDYLPQGISIGTERFPVLKADWLDGDSLADYVKQHHTEPSQMLKLLNSWCDLTAAFTNEGLAHGNLKPRHIIVKGDEIKLIDYENVNLATFKPKQSFATFDTQYQHPLRRKNDYGPHLDRFSFWLIYAALLGVYLDDKRFVRFFNKDSLLTRKRNDIDLESPLLVALREHEHNDLKELGNTITEMIKSAESLADIPPFKPVVLTAPAPEIGQPELNAQFSLTMPLRGSPVASDYDQVMPSYSTVIGDEILRTGKLVCDQDGSPIATKGGSSRIYCFDCGESKFAVKCFSDETPDRQVRYSTCNMNDEVRTSPFLVPFQYINEGIKIRQRWFPILKMDWVEGDLLHSYLWQNLDSPGKLQELADAWLEMSTRLRAAGIAHGDLSPENVFVVHGQIRLVDYDGMFVPELSQFTANEIGNSNYQHPNRGPKHFGRYIDNFADWVIYTTIVALSVDKSLWDFVSPERNRLLFSGGDFRDPDRSAMFQLLQNHRSNKLQALATSLRNCLDYPVEEVPQLNKPVPTYGFSEVSAPLPQTSSLIQKTPFGTYCAEITKASPACIVILIDQSEDMGKLFIANYKLKDFAAEIANRLIQSIVGACEGRQQDVKSWFRVALIKYAEAVSPAWERDLSGRDLVSAEELPLGSRLIQNSSGQFKEVWLNAAAAGSAKMETAFEYATDIASSFVTQYPHCYPPIVVNITASSLDQSALVAAEKLKTTLSSDGNTLLFNFFITPSSPSVIFPDYKEVPKVARAHFEISSVLPKKMLENAASSMSQYFFKGTRGLAVNAHADMIPKLLDVGDKNSR